MQLVRRQSWWCLKVNTKSGLLLILTFIAIYTLFPPYQRGFNCADQSIQNKFRPLLFSTKLLFFCTLFAPLVLIYIIERFYLPLNNVANISSNLSKYFFGFMANLTITELTKRTFGRLRPNTYDFCNLTQYCPSGLVDTYIDSFNCENPEHPMLITNARLSFYSGHSSLGSFAGTYLICYLNSTFFFRFGQYSFVRKCLCIVTNLLIYVLFLYPGYTQWLIKWHFLTDVLTGFTAGSLYALIVFFKVNREAPSLGHKLESIN